MFGLLVFFEVWHFFGSILEEFPGELSNLVEVDIHDESLHLKAEDVLFEHDGTLFFEVLED